jgi:hypothetical protein
LFSISEDSYSDIQAINIQLDVKTSNVLVPSLGTTIKILDFDFKGNTLNILSKATGTALITLDAKDYKGGIISTSFTVQVDAPLPIIDQDLKTIAVKTYPNPAGEVTFVSIITDNPTKYEVKTL